MSLVTPRTALSPNCDQKEIFVKFLILHYSSAGLDKTLSIFQDPKSRASAHLVVGEKGEIYEPVFCLKGRCFRAWHAGESRWQTENKTYRGFNDFSIGIELVNKNGNLFEYTKKQYRSLKAILSRLKKHYPALKNPERILGHEHIAGHRGKVDPGHCFNWPLFFKMNYTGPAPFRKALLPEEHRLKFLKTLSRPLVKTEEDWMRLNLQMENHIKSPV